MQRECTIPASLIKPGKTRSRFECGTSLAEAVLPPMRTSSATEIAKSQSKTGGYVSPDYREDFELGDEPYRYYNW